MDKNPYRHDGRADKDPYRHDRRADSHCHRVYQNHTAALFHPFTFSFLFLSNFQALKNFLSVTLFSGTVRP